MECEIVEISQADFLSDCYKHINCELIEICVPNGYGNVIRFIIDITHKEIFVDTSLK